VHRVTEAGPLVLAVDVGTTAMKCSAYDATGSAVAEATREYSLLTPHPGWVEMNWDAYWSALRDATADMWRRAPELAARVRGIGISAQGETLLAIGRNGEPLDNAIVWLDGRAHHEAAELRSRFPAEELYAVTGQPEMLAAWPAAKLLWLTRNRPELAAAAERYVLIEDQLIAELTGECVTEGSLATSTCYWNFRTKAWWPEMLEAVGVSADQLPAIVEPGAPVGTLRPVVAAELGLPPDVLVCAGALDQACGAIGAGNIDAGGFSANTGAAVALCATIDGPRLDPQRRMPCHYHGIPDAYMFHTFTSGGIVLRWFRDEFGGRGATYEGLAEQAAGVPAGADGLVLLPHFEGAMAPENNDRARGAVIGLTLRHTRGHVVRAIMESIAFVMRRNVEVMVGLSVPIEAVRSIGGGARSRLWKQIEADVLGLPVVTMRQPDAGTLGAAILAGAGLGWWPDLASAVAAMVAEDRVYEPQAANRQRYDDLYGVYRSSYSALEPSFEALAAATDHAPEADVDRDTHEPHVHS
jgi:xylulokinase